MNEAPEKPTIQEMKLYKNGKTIRGLKLWQVQTGSESSDTVCRIFTCNETIDAKWSAYKGLIEIDPFWDGIGKVKQSVIDKCKKWEQFITNNEEQYKIYLDLKKRFGE